MPGAFKYVNYASSNFVLALLRWTILYKRDCWEGFASPSFLSPKVVRVKTKIFIAVTPQRFFVLFPNPRVCCKCWTHKVVFGGFFSSSYELFFHPSERRTAVVLRPSPRILLCGFLCFCREACGKRLEVCRIFSSVQNKIYKWSRNWVFLELLVTEHPA